MASISVLQLRNSGLSLRGGGYDECGPRLLKKENIRKIEPKETPSCLILLLRVVHVFTWQLEILVTTLRIENYPKQSLIQE